MKNFGLYGRESWRMAKMRRLSAVRKAKSRRICMVSGECCVEVERGGYAGNYVVVLRGRETHIMGEIGTAAHFLTQSGSSDSVVHLRLGGDEDLFHLSMSNLLEHGGV